jgi:hypothetical protein
MFSQLIISMKKEFEKTVAAQIILKFIKLETKQSELTRSSQHSTQGHRGRSFVYSIIP